MPRKSVKIRCVETGKEYPSIKAAAEDTGVDSSNISNVAQGYAFTAGGYHWERVDETPKPRKPVPMPSIVEMVREAMRRECKERRPVSYGELQAEWLLKEAM